VWNRLFKSFRDLLAVRWMKDRWIKIASAFPVSPAASNRRGINSTDWIPIDRALYDQCLDRRDYRAGSGATDATSQEG
jgi:hypothetical protein